MVNISKNIEEYLEKEDVKQDFNTISLYDLYKIVEYKFEELKNLSVIKDRIKEKESTRFKSFFPFISECCESILSFPSVNDKKSFLLVRFNDKNHINDLFISKDEDDEQKFICNKKNRIIKKYYDDIKEIFDVMDKYHFEEESMCQKISHPSFNIRLDYDTDGIVSLNVCVNDFYDTNIINWKNCPPTLYETVKKCISIVGERCFNISEEKQISLLQKIPVNISALNDTIKPMVQDYLSMNNAPALVKKIGK